MSNRESNKSVLAKIWRGSAKFKSNNDRSTCDSNKNFKEDNSSKKNEELDFHL